ncbi:AraC family transcriptional regulator [Acidisoma sp. L85]|jgi:AraC-like DNA-binding protein|uniref:AraC family transcriptional regulator n=2 Tax=unclassified Acidisoma TaxID=2634065 RepID=UPI0020B158A1|nr:AraC family transcriptional regulator [Acidisoma sp. L85]
MIGSTERTIHASFSGMFDHSSRHGRHQGDSSAFDPVSELLLGMRLHGIEYRRLQLAPPFGIEFGTSPGRALFHFVAAGSLYLRDQAGVTHVLREGDAVLLPNGGRHDLLSAPDMPSRDVKSFESTQLCESVCFVAVCANGTETSRTADCLVFSGCMEFDLGAMHALIALMPEMMQVSTLLDRQPEIAPMLAAMEREVCTPRAGSAGILSQLANVVSASIVRGWVESGCGDATGWVEALRDPRLSRAIGAVHRDPGRNWTVAALAAETGSSRSLFAERFQAITGQTPLRYVAELRMRLAMEWIGRGRMPIDAVAERLGYGSQAAFSRAFKRVTGQPPGAMRASSNMIV